MLTTLNLKGNQLRDTGAAALSEVLGSIVASVSSNILCFSFVLTLRHVLFSNAITFAQVIRIREVPSELNLEENDIGEHGVIALFEVPVQKNSLMKVVLFGSFRKSGAPYGHQIVGL